MKRVIIASVIGATGLYVASATGAPAPDEPVAVVPSSSPSPTSDAAVLVPPVTVERIIDGDTIATSAGTVRLLGIDTPEKGACGFSEATASLADLLPVGSAVDLVVGNAATTDKYDRLLRYVRVGQVDAGLLQISSGYADARYDSRDGYGIHPMEAEYVAADATPNSVLCQTPLPVPSGTSEPAAPWNAPGPDLDCADIGNRVVVAPPDYHRLDADGDGYGCDAW